LNEKGKALQGELGKKVAFYRADATSASETEALMKFVVERFGRLDCVVNNAGAGGEGDLLPKLQSKVSIDQLAFCSVASSWELNMVCHAWKAAEPSLTSPA
jgi:NAD(P)-dependent dehydrogenase (short-subunit alcohol dehydrogenase family)